jgi:hypothetical protein
VKKKLIDNSTQTGFRILACVVWFALAIVKQVDHTHFEQYLQSVWRLNYWGALLAAQVATFAELLLGVAMILTPNSVAFRSWLLCLPSAFVVHYGWRLWTREETPCGCLGSLYSLSNAWGLVFSILLLAISAQILFARNSTSSRQVSIDV